MLLNCKNCKTCTPGTLVTLRLLLFSFFFFFFSRRTFSLTFSLEEETSQPVTVIIIEMRKKLSRRDHDIRDHEDPRGERREILFRRGQRRNSSPFGPQLKKRALRGRWSDGAIRVISTYL